MDPFMLAMALLRRLAPDVVPVLAAAAETVGHDVSTGDRGVQFIVGVGATTKKFSLNMDIDIETKQLRYELLRIQGDGRTKVLWRAPNLPEAMERLMELVE
jgi:hypothetical protein